MADLRLATAVSVCAVKVAPAQPGASPEVGSWDSGESKFTTWAYKFALLEAAVKLRRRAWQGREVLVATTLNGVPIDVLADRLNTSRGALYKTLHDARHKLLTHLAAQGLSFTGADGKEDER
jgi:hypothetical protein